MNKVLIASKQLLLASYKLSSFSEEELENTDQKQSVLNAFLVTGAKESIRTPGKPLSLDPTKLSYPGISKKPLIIFR